MKTRAITGIFFVVIMVVSTLLGPFVFNAFYTLLSAWCLYEFYGIVTSDERSPNKMLGIVINLTLFVLGSLVAMNLLQARFLWLIVPLISLTYLVSLFQKRVFPFNDIAYTFLGIGYVSLPFFLFAKLGFIQGDFNHYIPLGFLILLWTNDTGAYLAGRSFGKHKLFERISPKKTWEGFFGGFILAIVVAINLHKYFATLPLWQWITVAAVISIIGTLGDLVESMLKRSLHVKDSGNILPGHGGFLDRFDGLLLAAPIVYIFLILIA
ncbi:phosphatidate cytidylyltransferase [Sphingobacterium thalpophilum]|uniref:Phosphatidate cytidylyltransferase n=2 Tax=Sphingobacterium thalpophilum TaxID=259 RepID=A0ABV4H949_9SPHI|nr:MULTISPECIES: phosphatidate cytidylyltransferase [Sphingobacterium]MCW8311041.1 phosphatidate cytidylyltransferase [Sphingobacterium sp. InxBP1]